jgi:hypothetical protein
MLAAELEDVLDAAFLAKVIQLADEFDLEALFGRQTFGEQYHGPVSLGTSGFFGGPAVRSAA